jgi:transcriptional regulator with XRE-family HTH domain
MSTTMSNNFGNWLMQELKERDWTQSDLARATGLTRQAISYFIGGKSKTPDDDSLHRIAKALKLPPVQVYREAGLLPPEPDVTKMIEQILHEIEGMPEIDQQEVLAFIKMKNNLRQQREKKKK